MDMNPNKINDPENNIRPPKKTFFSKIKEMAQKAKTTFNRHITTRIWPKPQENNKGPKF